MKDRRFLPLQPRRSKVGPAQVATPAALLPHINLRGLLAPLYQAAIQGMPTDTVLEYFCRSLARAAQLPWVAISSPLENGAFSLRAASAENALWAAMQRIPERWDGTIAGHGPAAQALRKGVAVQMTINDEAFALWRQAAERECVRCVWAWPFSAHGNRCVLHLYSTTDCQFLTKRQGHDARVVAKGLEALLADLLALDRIRLLAHMPTEPAEVESDGG